MKIGGVLSQGARPGAGRVPCFKLPGFVRWTGAPYGVRLGPGRGPCGARPAPGRLPGGALFASSDVRASCIYSCIVHFERSFYTRSSLVSTMGPKRRAKKGEKNVVVDDAESEVGPNLKLVGADEGGEPGEEGDDASQLKMNVEDKIVDFLRPTHASMQKMMVITRTGTRRQDCLMTSLESWAMDTQVKKYSCKF